MAAQTRSMRVSSDSRSMAELTAETEGDVPSVKVTGPLVATGRAFPAAKELSGVTRSSLLRVSRT
ncbi:MAG: hypothetical protein A4E72_00893 [Syntrophus sp. PtaU1.Bin208]|nr:MAG: hypothetical protein A4E72_00893 [Syntrophus sp. PtaU1.Bin208]